MLSNATADVKQHMHAISTVVHHPLYTLTVLRMDACSPLCQHLVAFCMSGLEFAFHLLNEHNDASVCLTRVGVLLIYGQDHIVKHMATSDFSWIAW